MLKLDVTLKDESDGTEEELHAVAKMIPEQEFVRKIFNIQVTFKNEVAMYNVIAPTLRDFQRENGVNEVIDCFPELYGARLNLGEQNGNVDENAVLILENLNFKEYQCVDRHVGFDLETAQLILKDLAAFHAIPLALKLKKPEVFDEKIRPYLAPFPFEPKPIKEEIKSVFLEMLQDSYKCIPWIPKVKNIFENVRAAGDAPPKEPFATVTHGDMWFNNTMNKISEQGTC
uniref:CHK kinase-like domain-containing protein n=1 Tax=Anoplophora glabripennis TaxID=217634 RepID=V5G064_ANOGL